MSFSDIAKRTFLCPGDLVACGVTIITRSKSKKRCAKCGEIRRRRLMAEYAEALKSKK